MIRSPFWYDAADNFHKVTDDYIVNIGNTPSAPIIKLVGNESAKVDVT